MARKPRNMVIQQHHITYNPEWTVYIRMTEHWILTNLQRMVVPTKGFIKSLKHYILVNESRAVSGLKIKKNQMALFKLGRKVDAVSRRRNVKRK